MDTPRPLFFITPPFTQINTPYPATACLKGFLNTRNIRSRQADLGLEVILAIFSGDGLARLFGEVAKTQPRLSPAHHRLFELRDSYSRTIGPVMDFLHGKNPTLAPLICSGNWLPQGARFSETADLEWAFGTMGTTDKARHLATLYLEDISDFISATTDSHFGFSRYAEKLGRSPETFDELETELLRPDSFTSSTLLHLLKQKIVDLNPSLVAITVPFPGNLFSALKCGQWIKKHHPGLKVVMGGGYPATELRSLSDPGIFDYVDFIILDDGEAPLIHLIEHLEGKRSLQQLTRTLTRTGQQVIYMDGSEEKDIPQRDIGTPDYADLLLDQYLPVIELANPMHRLWSDGRWNRLTLAHGCYWGKCTFCDVTLSYISRYEPNTAALVCDRMELLISQTGERGFHFVDEAAPPALLKELALEILRRGLPVVWWTNIRFEKHFTRDLCMLLHQSGCIAVSGGLEVASDRILKLINKGVSVPQVARVASHFTHAGIMVHAYLMYGFPTQTARETVDALEVVRQLFMHGLVRSGFWHLFTMTAHSPVGQNPAAFGAERLSEGTAPFANNDLAHTDNGDCDHESFGEGLRKALYNYMHGVCFDFPLSRWFSFGIPATTIAPSFIQNLLDNKTLPAPSSEKQIAWTGGAVSVRYYQKEKKNKITPMAALTLHHPDQDTVIRVSEPLGKFLHEKLPVLSVRNRNSFTFGEWIAEIRQIPVDPSAFISSDAFRLLRENGFLLI
jgi:hypothetical protein